MKAGAPRRQDGFTLVELLASLTILGLISLMIVAGLGGRGAAWSRIDRDTAGGEAVEAAQARLADYVRRAAPVTLYSRPPRPDFDGQATSLFCLSPPAPGRGPGPLRRRRLSVDARGDLVLESVSDVAVDRKRFTDREVLLSGVQSLDLAYYGATDGGRPAWRPQWSRQITTPQLIRIRLTLPEGDRRRWPDLLVHPAADVDTECLLSPETGGCRGR